MRELLTDSLHPLTRLLRFLTLLVVLIAEVSLHTYGLPPPIGRLSDYGNVLDRYGRERINALIDQAYQRFGIEIYILASWESPGGDINHFAYALLDAWDLIHGQTLLVVFLKTENSWDVRVLAGEKTAASYPQLATHLEEGVRNLVTNRRIEEAMVELFDVLGKYLLTGTRAVAKGNNGGDNRLLYVFLFLAFLALTAVFIHRRICPRCGRVLRVQRTRSLTTDRQESVIYYCVRCGYSRTKRGEG